MAIGSVGSSNAYAPLLRPQAERSEVHGAGGKDSRPDGDGDDGGSVKAVTPGAGTSSQAGRLIAVA